MDRLKHYIFVRHAHNWRLLFRFGVVGLTGVFVNLLVTILCNKIGPDEHSVFLGLPLTDFNVRWYHVFSTDRLPGRQPVELPAQPGLDLPERRSTPAGCGSTCRSSPSACSPRSSAWAS